MTVEPMPPPKPTIAEIVHACVMAGRSAQDILTMSCEAHPAKPLAAIKAEIVGAFQAGVGKEVGAENLGKIGDAVARELDRLETEAPRPTAPIYWIVDRIVRQKLDAVEARGASETEEIRAWVIEAAGVINQHPAHPNIFWWLAMEGLENMFSSAAMERGIGYAIGRGSPEVEATQEDLDYLPPED
jgi:hypothetical protein